MIRKTHYRQSLLVTAHFKTLQDSLSTMEDVFNFTRLTSEMKQ